MGVSDRALRVDAGASETIRVRIPRNDPPSGAWFYEVRVEPEADTDRPAYLCESRPYRWTGTSSADPEPADRVVAAPGPATENHFERRLDDNEYALAYCWQGSRGAEWSVPYRVRRSTYEAAVAGERGYVKTYEESLSSPVVRGLVDALADARRTSQPAQAGTDASESPVLGDLDARRRFVELVRFVQHVDYARDAATLDTYDYNRTVPETLVAGVGDCKDLTHLLAGLLSTAFDCETALLFQSGHLLLGVAAADVPALPYEPDSVVLGGRELVPIDPSLDDRIGHRTDEPFVAAYGGGEWFYHDVGALGRGVGDVARDWLKLATPFA
ncbi:hypothetical protein [Halobacterium zhouii]|uniref:hypothetical protein n=1 Tax=Halobacterium zhouii TaxID=2902624 RepID=UPI001E3E66D7|nr:hypothetical protein [Halobacterium zhouii]